ncbi:MAG: methyl-accepting chemotaxis protein [Candidatus Zixiibacteriota bacterium]
MRNMKTKTKIMTGFIALLTLLVAISVVSYFTLNGANSGLGEYRYIARNSNTVAEAQARTLMVRMNAKDFLITGSQKDIDECKDYYKKATALIDEAIANIEIAEEKRVMQEVRNKIDKYMEDFDKVVDLSRKGTMSAEIEMNDVVTNSLDVIGPEIAEDMDGVRAGYTERQDKLGPELVKANNRALAIIMIVAGFSILVGIVLSLKISNEIVRPLTFITNATKKLAIGDINLEGLNKSDLVDISQNKDEVGDIGRAVSDMVEYQEKLSDVAQGLSIGNTDVKVKKQSDKDQLSIAMIDMIGYFREMVEIADRIGQNDLTVKIAKKSNDDKLSQAMIDMRDNIKSSQDEIEQTLDKNKRAVAEVQRLIEASLDGDLDERAEIGDHDGEQKKLLKGINEMLDAILLPINEAAEVLKAAANRDLSKRVKGNYKGKLKELKDNINDAVGNLDNALVKVAQAVEQLTSASAQIASGSQSLAEGANEQASSLEEVSSSLEEMSSMTKQNSENAVQANSLSEDASSAATDGNKAMDKMSKAINNIKESSDSTAKIIKTINDIAFQTNLLALNAAVEAARAGDAGKGFAVVAEEVRNLAQRSAEAAKNTEALIEEAQNNSDSGVEISEEVAEILGTIVTGATKVNDLIREITAASKEQSNGIEQVNIAVAQMNKVTQQNSANSEESASAAQQLNNQAKLLAELTNGFTLTKIMAAPQQASPMAYKKAAGSGIAQRKDTSNPEKVIPLDENEFADF